MNKLKKIILKRDGHVCAKCGSEHDLTVDHVFPLSHGGKNVLKNMQTLCLTCNQLKGEKIEFLNGFLYDGDDETIEEALKDYE